MRHTIISCFSNCFCCILLNIRNCRIFCKGQELLKTPRLLNQHQSIHIFKAIGYHGKCFYMKVIQFLIIKANTTSENCTDSKIKSHILLQDNGQSEHKAVNIVVTGARRNSSVYYHNITPPHNLPHLFLLSLLQNVSQIKDNFFTDIRHLQ